MLPVQRRRDRDTVSMIDRRVRGRAGGRPPRPFRRNVLPPWVTRGISAFPFLPASAPRAGAEVAWTIEMGIRQLMSSPLRSRTREAPTWRENIEISAGVLVNPLLASPAGAGEPFPHRRNLSYGLADPPLPDPPGFAGDVMTAPSHGRTGRWKLMLKKDASSGNLEHGPDSAADLRGRSGCRSGSSHSRHGSYFSMSISWNCPSPTP
jgi:hypothetical protein